MNPREAAFAKVNLYLEVLARRADGYHDLDSLAVFADTGEYLEAENDDRLSLAITGPMAGALDGAGDNLVLRAATLLAAEAGVTPKIRLRLHKTIPVAAGLGGGSADAAAALRLLNRLWRLDWPQERLRQIAARLGADIPACVHHRAVYLRGTGTELAVAPAPPPLGILIVNPGIAVATPKVFAGVTPQGGAVRPLASWRDQAAFIAALAGRRNDLEAPARSLAPVIGECLAGLEKLPGALLTRMSGSGASCFALFATAAEAAQGRVLLAIDQPGWWQCFATIE